MATILQLLNADRNLSLFSRGVRLAELENKLNEIGPFTILGPVNLAMKRLGSPSYEQLLEPANKSRLLEFISGYIIPGKTMIDGFRNDQRFTSLNGSIVMVVQMNEETLMNGAKILARDRQGSNGVIHLLDKTYGSN